jgi:inner membrane protein
MDNITHTIIGLSVGEAVLQLRMKDRLGLRSELRPFYWLSSAIANNLPDLDVPWIRLFSNTKLDFLLQHRGYSHSLGAILPFALLTLLFCFCYARARSIELQKKDWVWLFGLSVFGVICHLFADSWNSYGVHPFWPLQNHWYYGDSIFILEPWIWITLIPCLLFSGMPRSARALFLLLFSGILGVAWGIGYVPWQLSLLLTIVAILGLATKMLTPLRRCAYSFLMFSFVLGGFFAVSQYTKGQISSRFHAVNPDNEQKDIILTPTPANPFCWNYISVENNKTEYVLRTGLFAPFSQVFPVEDCPILREAEQTAPLSNVGAGFPGELLSLGTFHGSLNEFHELDKNCFFSAFRRFARAPFWIKQGKEIVIGDLRFDRNKKLDFAKMIVPANPGNDCPKSVPPWDDPLAL